MDFLTWNSCFSWKKHGLPYTEMYAATIIHNGVQKMHTIHEDLLQDSKFNNFACN